MTSVSASWHHADFLQESDFTAEQLSYLIDLAGRLKIERAAGTEQQRLVGRNVALILEKTSTRTRISFEVACRDRMAPQATERRYQVTFVRRVAVLAEGWIAVRWAATKRLVP